MTGIKESMTGPITSPKIINFDRSTNTVEVEFVNDVGDVAVGLFELIGWTKPPRLIVREWEQDMWVEKSPADH